MEIISLNVGRPRLVMWRGEPVSTGIYKEPVEGRIKLRTLNLDGDRQADLTVHGGPMKAVYAYPAEHYEFWRAELPGMQLPWGMFGENLTTTGLDESGVYIGDRFRAGTAELMVTQPRMPCYKLGIKFGRPEILKRFLASGRTGFYFSVTKEGEVARGDRMELIERDEHRVTVSEITRLYVHERTDVEAMQRAASLEALPLSWRAYFQERIEKAASGGRPLDDGGRDA